MTGYKVSVHANLLVMVALGFDATARGSDRFKSSRSRSIVVPPAISQTQYLSEYENVANIGKCWLG